MISDKLSDISADNQSISYRYRFIDDHSGSYERANQRNNGWRDNTGPKTIPQEFWSRLADEVILPREMKQWCLQYGIPPAFGADKLGDRVNYRHCGFCRPSQSSKLSMPWHYSPSMLELFAKETKGIPAIDFYSERTHPSAMVRHPHNRVIVYGFWKGNVASLSYETPTSIMVRQCANRTDFGVTVYLMYAFIFGLL